MTANTHEKILEVRGLTKTYGGVKKKGAKQPTPTLDVLKGIDIDIYRGDVVCLIGPSGCGKSTFLRCLNRLEIPTSGSIKFEGVEVDDAHIDAVRQKMGMVFQHFNLFPHLTVKKNLELAPSLLKLKDKEAISRRADELLARVGLADKANVYPKSLSGGQQQRIAIARALAMDPDVILCHHLYLLTAIVRELFPDKKVYGVSHGSDLRQIRKTEQNREYILQRIPALDGIFALHEEQKEMICGIYGEHIREKVRVIGTGYNSDVFRQEMGASQGEEKELRLIFAGKISEKKGVKSLIRSLDYLKDSGLIISLELAGGAGDEGEYQEIRELAEKCPFAVAFAGKITQQELAKKMNQSDVFVLPSFYEGLPLVIIEALACGTYVICTDLPGIRNWIDQNLPDNGVVFVEPPKRVNEDEPVEEELPVFEKKLAGAIEGIAKYPGSKPEKEHLEQISWDGLCAHLMQIFEQ